MPLLLEQNSLLLSEFFMENGEMSYFSCYYQGKLLFLHLDLNICYICPVCAGNVQIAEYKPFDTNAYEIKKQTGNGRFGYAYIINYIDQLTNQEKRSCPYLNILYGAFSSCSLYLEYRQYSLHENKQTEGSRYKAWTILCLSCRRSLGGNPK